MVVDPQKSSRAILSVGAADWPLPIPIVKRKGKWYFDSKAGRQEILNRRIGANELDAIQVCRGFVEAQWEYASTGTGFVWHQAVCAEDHQFAGQARWTLLAE